MLKLIALTGKKTAGKTLAADYLVKKYGYVKVNFKDAVIDEVKEKMPETMRLLAKEYKKKNIHELFLKPYPDIIRSILREYATDITRAQDPGHWVMAWKERKDRIQGDQVVVDDVRFQNEESAIRSAGGIIIKINRENTDNSDTHPSEAEMDKIDPDITIFNIGTKKDLYGMLDEIVG